MTAAIANGSELAEQYFAAVAVLDRRTVARVLAAWGVLDLADAQTSFGVDVLPVMIAALVEAQEVAADLGARYVARDASDQGAGPGERLNPRGFAGLASDGRSLAGLLAQPLIQTFMAVRAGASPVSALDAGAQSLDRIVTTQVQDAARTAEATAITGNRSITGYVRTVEPKACGRCVILAGRFYRWNAGFLRHPACRCDHRPMVREIEPQDPRTLFDSMSAEDQARAFTAAGAEAIRLGADPARIVNARRGMSTTVSAPGRQIRSRVTVVGGQRVFTTTVLAKRGRVRLMPESILELATDREDAIRLLRFHKYIF